LLTTDTLFLLFSLDNKMSTEGGDDGDKKRPASAPAAAPPPAKKPSQAALQQQVQQQLQAQLQQQLQAAAARGQQANITPEQIQVSRSGGAVV
jgi:hypothetical protein